MTAARSNIRKLQFSSPPAEIPGLVKVSGTATQPYQTQSPPAQPSRMPAQMKPPSPPERESFGPALNLQSVILRQVGVWGVIAVLSVWLLAGTGPREAIAPAIVLLAATGLVRLLIERRIARGAVSQRGGITAANLALLTAVSFAGIAGASLVSPVTLIIPALVWSISATAPKTWMINASARVAIVVTAGIAVLSASRFAETPTTVAGSIALGGAMAVAIVLCSMHGRQAGPQLLQTTPGELGKPLPADGENPMAAVRSAISSQNDPVGIATTAARAINASFSPAYVAVVEHVPHSNMFMPLAEIVSDASTVDLGRRLAGVTESVLSRGTPLWMLDDADDTFTITCRRMGIQAALIVPLEHLSHRIGAIQIAWSEPLGPVTLADALAYSTELAAIITPDLAIAQFASEIERGYFSAISSLAAKVDDRDEFTRGHSRRVAKHALTIAEALDLDDVQQRKLLYAAELHDIGRIGVSEDILSKPGALSADEWAQVRAYPGISADIVEPLSFFTDVREVVLHQNERWDGKGYPDHLSGIQIPLLSRILAVADAFDAMTSPRAYRSAMPAQQALTELWKARGAKYDPEIVEAFVMSGTVRQKIS